MVKVVVKSLAVLLAALPLLVSAALQGLRINGVELPARSLELLAGAVARESGNANTVYEGVIDNRLLAEWAESRLAAEAMKGIDSEVEADVFERLRSVLPADATPAHTESPLAGAILRRMLAAPPHQQYQLSPDQQRVAENSMLARQQTPGERAFEVSLWDVYQRESIQGLAELHAGNSEYLMERARALLFQRWQLAHWQQRDLLDSATLAGLHRMARDKHIKQRWLLEQGLTGDMHHESAAAEARWRKQPESELKRYYDAHPELFQQVQHVEADYLLLSSQLDADRLHSELSGNLSFADALKRETAAGATTDGAPKGGSLSVENDGKSKSMLQKLALLQLPGLSRPFRTGQGWIIFHVTSRKDRLLPFSDESVRHTCARAVAQEQAQAEFDALRIRLRQAATIEPLQL